MGVGLNFTITVFPLNFGSRVSISIALLLDPPRRIYVQTATERKERTKGRTDGRTGEKIK